MKKLTLLLFLICGALHAQTNHYIATASSTSLRLQMPASSGSQLPIVEFPDAGRAGASVTCASADTAVISWNGTGATTTAGTAVGLPPTTQPAAVKVFTASNGSAGTTGPSVAIPAATTVGIDLGWFKMGSSGITNNITITTSGTCTIAYIWGER